MKTIKATLTKLLQGFHASYFMAFFMLFTAAAMEISQILENAVVASIATTSLTRLTSLPVSYVFIKWLLVIFAAIIFVRRPSPAGAFVLSSPLIIYGGYAFRYLSEAGLSDLSLLVLLVGGYIGVALLIGVSTLLAASEHERQDCVSLYESLIKEHERLNAELKHSLEASRATRSDNNPVAV